MSDLVVTVPKGLWTEWIAEGDLPGDSWAGEEYAFWTWGYPAQGAKPGIRVYVVAHGRLRGYAPLVRVDRHGGGRVALIRGGGAVAVTIDEPIRGFQGWRYRWWSWLDEERPFPDWKTP